MQDNSFFSKYKYVKKLGQGGCGSVFLAENKILGNLWAVKEIPKSKKTSISGYIEPDILKRLNHPALPRICDVYEDEANFYIVEDYLEGKCLKQELDKKGKFSEHQVIDWAIQLCSVLDYLHKQKPYPIIYGDLKPHNIILTREGFLKLIDFGVSTLMSDLNSKIPTDIESTTSFIGTKGYAAPEQFLGGKNNCTSDIYSLGITLIQLLTGIDPIKTVNFLQNEKVSELLSPGLWDILQKCIQIKPDMRYQSAEILLRELRKYSFKTSCQGIAESAWRENPGNITKMIAVTGIRSTGVSTITGALAQAVTGGSLKACIVDLSVAGAIRSSLTGRPLENEVSGAEIDAADKVYKINSKLYYIHLSNIVKNDAIDYSLLLKHLSQIKDKFSYLFLDVDITQIAKLEQYMNFIFIVSDMNPFNIKKVKTYLESAEMMTHSASKAFIINKFHKGELSSATILKCLLLDKDATEPFHTLVNNLKIYEVPYDPKVYFNWIYSFFGQPIKFNSVNEEPFNRAITKVVSCSILPGQRQKTFRNQLAHFFNRRI